MTETSNIREAQRRAEQSNQQLAALFPGLLGIKMVEVASERTIGELTARDDLKNVWRMVHGGALGALADTCANQAAIAATQPNMTVTLELKVN